MGRVISLVNQKGGVGKTTSSVNLASALALRNQKSLVIDMDPQGNASRALQTKTNQVTIYEVLCEKQDIEQSLQKTKTENLFLIPSDIHLAGLAVELYEKESWEFCLKNKIEALLEKFDYIFIDSPPSLGPLTINVLTASHNLLVPLQCEYYALEGLSQLLNTISRVKENLNPYLVFSGILLTMFDSRNRLSKQIEWEVRKHFKDKVFQTVVPRNVRLSEAPGFGKNIFQYDPQCSGALNYKALSAELMAKWNQVYKKPICYKDSAELEKSVSL